MILTLRRGNQEDQDFKVIFGSIASLGKLGLHEMGVGLEKRERGGDRKIVYASVYLCSVC